jgi:prevent-host-death family protein
MKRQTIGIREAKAQFSRLVREAQGGREWLITDHGRPVAKLVPVEDDVDLAERIRRLEVRGVIEPPSPDQGPLPPPLPVPFGALADALQADRNERPY